MIISPQQIRILRYLRGKNWTSPTQIGMDLHRQHSAWASPKCLKLVAAGKLRRSKRGWYKLPEPPKDDTP